MQATAQLVVVCDGCKSRYRVAAEHAGKRLKCRSCGLIISVPLHTAAAPKPAAAARPASLRAKAPPRAPASPPAQPPRPAGGSARERAAQRRPKAQVGPMHYVVASAIVLVIVLYLAFSG